MGTKEFSQLSPEEQVEAAKIMKNETMLGLLDKLTIAHGHSPSATFEIRPRQVAVLARAAVKIGTERIEGKDKH